MGVIARIMHHDHSSRFLGDILIAFNMGGIFFALLVSIWQRARLIKEAHDLDDNHDTPSDYALYVSNLDPKVFL